MAYLVHNWATSGHWVAHHESTLLESVPKQLGFVTIFEDVMTWWPGAQHQRLCKGGFSNLHGDSKSQHLSWLLTVPSCSPEAAVSPATLVWYPWQLREHGLWWCCSYHAKLRLWLGWQCQSGCTQMKPDHHSWGREKAFSNRWQGEHLDS